MRRFKIVVEEHAEGFTAWPLGIQGAVVGQGSTRQEALADVSSAIRFHIETFGPEVLDVKNEVLHAWLEEAEIAF